MLLILLCCRRGYSTLYSRCNAHLDDMIPLRIVAFACALVVATAAQEPQSRVQLALDASAAEAVLAILDLRAQGKAPSEADWQRLFTCEPYQRLKQREAQMNRDFTDQEFRDFVLSPGLAERAAALRTTLEQWKSAPIHAAAERVLAYLPEEARIRAKVYPMIKPRTNSFVFEPRTDPAIFLYLDLAVPAAKFENTVAHELHHIGFASISERIEAGRTQYPPTVRAALEWMGAFGEGFAMLAAAGSPDADPHAVSSAEERARWERDLAMFNRDLKELESFFLHVIQGRFGSKDDERKKAFSFFGDAQGPWYTVGWRMAQMVEKRYGRAILLECMAQPEELLRAYNQVAAERNRRGEDWARWSDELLHLIELAR